MEQSKGPQKFELGGYGGRVGGWDVTKTFSICGIILHLSISTGPPWALKVGGLTDGDTVRGTRILILVKSV